MVIVRVVFEWNYTVVELNKIPPFFGGIKFLIFLHQDRRYSNILIPVLRHNQDYNFVSVQYDDLWYLVFGVQEPVLVVHVLIAICCMQFFEL